MNKKFLMFIAVLLLPYSLFSQYSFKELDSIIDRCSLDSSCFYLNKQKKVVSTTDERFRSHVNFSQYYRSVNEYEQALLCLDSSSAFIHTKENKGVYFQNKGLIKHFQVEYSNAVEYFEKSLVYFEKGGKRAAAYHSLSNTYKKLRQYDSVYVYLNKAKKSFNQEDNPIGYGVVSFDIAGYHFDKGQYDSSYVYYMQSLKIYESENDKIRESKTYSLLSNVFWAQKDYREAIRAAQKSDSISQMMSYKEGHLVSTLTIAKIYVDMQEYDSATYYLQPLLVELGEENKYLAIKQHVVSALANVYVNRGEVDLALKYQEKALLYAKSLGNLGAEVVSYYNLGDYYAKKLDSSNAKKMFLKTYCYKDSILKLELMKVVCERLSSIYELEDKDSALFFYKEYNLYKDSIKNFNVQKELKINQLKIDSLFLSNQLENEKKGVISERKQNSTLFLGIAISVVLVVFATFLYKRTRKDNSILERHLSSASNKVKEKDLELYKFKKYIQSPEASKKLLDNLSTDKNWAKFMIDFELLYPNFFSNLNLKEGVSLTKNDCRIAALIHLKLSNKEFAEILNITLSGVKNAKGRFNSKLEND